MTKTKSNIPLDIATMARWLALDPKANVKELETFLTKAKPDQYEQVAEKVRVALKWAWDEQPQAFFTQLSPWLKSSSARLRRVAVGALPLSHEDYKNKCIRLLKKLMIDRDQDTRYMAIDLLAENVNQHMDLVKRWVKDDDPGVRTIVARHLQHIDPEQIRSILPIFEPLVVDPDPDVHWTAASTLLELYDREPRPVLETMRAMATCEREEVRAASAACFFEHVFADHFDQLLPTVRSWLRTGDPLLRWTLVRSLRFVQVTPRSLQLLRALYEDKDPEIRRRLVLVLLKVYDPENEATLPIRDLLLRAQEDPSKRVRDLGAQALETFGPNLGLVEPEPEE